MRDREVDSGKQTLEAAVIQQDCVRLPEGRRRVVPLLCNPFQQPLRDTGPAHPLPWSPSPKLALSDVRILSTSGIVYSVLYAEELSMSLGLSPHLYSRDNNLCSI